jgi:Spy/CpxP family protein refolding chaperone
MTPRKKTLAILASVAGCVLAIGAALAVEARHYHHGGPFGEFGFGHGMARALASLDLTDEQKSQMKAILKDEEPRIEPLMDRVLSTKKDLFDAVHARTFDETGVRSASTAAARASADMAVEKARMVARIRDVLTDEQQERLETIHKEFEQRLEKRIGLARSIWKEHAADFIDAL